MNIIEQLKLHEGFKKFPYKDTEGFLTIGYGWNLDANGLPEDICEELLKRKIKEVEKGLMKYDWFVKLNDVRKKVLVDMAYNLGVPGLLKFRNMIEAIKNNDFNKAKDEMIDSEWHNQVGTRAYRLERMMETGKN